MLAKLDPRPSRSCPGAARAWHRPDVLRPHPARRHPEHGRPPARPPARAHQGVRPGLHLLHAPRDRVLPPQARVDCPASARSPSTSPATSTTCPRQQPRLPPRRDLDARGDGHLGRVQPPRGCPGQNEIDLRYADALSDRRQHHDVPHRHQGGRLEQGIFASFMPKPFAEHPGSGMHTHLSLFEGDTNAFHEPGALYQLSKTGRQFIAGLLQHGAEITAVTNQWVNSYKRLWAEARRLPTSPGAQQPLGAGARADVQADQGQQQPDRGAQRRHGVQPLPDLRVLLAAGLKGSRRPTTCRPRPRTTSGASPTPSARRWASSRSPPASARRSP